MAQISNTYLKAILDKMSRHAAEANGDILDTAIAAAAAYTFSSPNSGLSVANSAVLSSLDTEVLTTIADPVLTSAIYAQVHRNNTNNPQLVSDYWRPVLDGLDSYGLLSGNVPVPTDKGGLDTMLRILNATAPTVRAHGAFSQYFGRLSPGNVFVPRVFTLATVAVSGASAGTMTLSGYALNGLLDTTKYGPAQIALLVTNSSGNTSQGAITFNAIKNGVSAPITITAGATTYEYLTAASDTSQTFSGVANTTVTITTGTSGDTYSIVLLPDRTIASA